MSDGTDSYVEVDTGRCMASGACVYAAPEVFRLGKKRHVEVVGDVDLDPQAVRAAVDDCPTGALSLVQRDRP
ncbi:ferredoxin [Mycobacterium sp. 94-17]|uniref:ferredoxin n=1 Tax=Mycobacterium sp. 94-17 TaxID=2986147 RepID=UPI002D1F3D20|nr:ferredoxin [Mycobacterium sp. 94-17]MEB4209769.1 ferredoxin [Mycobacterium sp. 94-17]